MINTISTLRKSAASQNVQGHCTARALFASQAVHSLNLFSPVFAGTLPNNVDYEVSFPNDEEFIAACCEGRIPYISVVGWVVIQGHQIQAPGHVSAFVSAAESQAGRYTHNLTIPHQIYYEDGTAVGAAAHGSVELQLDARCYFTCFIQGMALMPIPPGPCNGQDDGCAREVRVSHDSAAPNSETSFMSPQPRNGVETIESEMAPDQADNIPDFETPAAVKLPAVPVIIEGSETSSTGGSTSTADSKLKARKAKQSNGPSSSWINRKFNESDRLTCKQNIMAVSSPTKDGFIDTSRIRELSASEVVERLDLTSGNIGASDKLVGYVGQVMEAVQTELDSKSVYSDTVAFSNAAMYERMLWRSGQFEVVISNSAVTQLINRGGNPGTDWLDVFMPEHEQYTRFVFAFKHEYFLPSARGSQGFVLVPVSSLSSSSATITSLLKAPISQMERALRQKRFDAHMWVKVGKKGVVLVSNDAKPDDTSGCVDLFAQGTDFFSPVVNLIINARKSCVSTESD